MYQQIFRAYQNLSKGDQADLKRCNLQKIANSPAYFRVLKRSGAKDNKQTLRILYLITGISIGSDDEGDTVAEAFIKAGVKEQYIVQIVRSGDNSMEYMKRQLVRCENIRLDSIGRLAQFWGENERRKLLKNYILSVNTDID